MTSGLSCCRLKTRVSLFAEAEQDIKLLKKVPFDFYYRYLDPRGTEWRHKISDWEAGALYWNVVRNHGKDWQTPFRKKLERELLQRDLMFLMGTLHRFPEQWLIVSLIYPPKRLQQSLLVTGPCAVRWTMAPPSSCATRLR